MFWCEVKNLPLRVTFYARVSTDTCEQLNSLENQVMYFEKYIKSQDNWTFVSGYVDEGISGTSVKNATYEIEVDSIKAPVKPGAHVGTLTIKEDNNTIRKIPVTVEKKIKKANILELYIRYLEEVFSGEIHFS